MKSPGPVPPSDAARVARAVLRLARRLRAERPDDGVTLSSLGLLSTLHRKGPMRAIDLARAERLKPQSLSRLLPRLEAQGLIARSEDPADRRTLRIALTGAGRRVLRRDLAARRAWLERAVSSALSAGERTRLGDAAALMLRLADAGDDPVPGEAR